jgi:hypothetical protein
VLGESRPFEGPPSASLPPVSWDDRPLSQANQMPHVPGDSVLPFTVVALMFFKRRARAAHIPDAAYGILAAAFGRRSEANEFGIGSSGGLKDQLPSSSPVMVIVQVHDTNMIEMHDLHVQLCVS